MEPAPVSLPPNIKTVAVVNRTQVSQATRGIDAVHKVLSLESNNLQKAGAQASLNGLSDELMKNNRFTDVKPLTLELSSYGAGVFPSALQWDSVDKICRENNTDALFSLELFDAESKLNYGITPANINLGGLANIPAIENNLSMNTQVKTGWRIYDPSSRTILDEYILSKDISSSGSGINPAVAASALAGRIEAVKEVGTQAGQAYASRILPYCIRVSRDYFVRGDQNFIIATRRARAGNWDGAAALWKEETKNTARKIAGRACYNMAIIAEINGDLDGAIMWAQKSYEDYRIGLGLEYVNILQYRKQQNEVLKSQTVASSGSDH